MAHLLESSAFKLKIRPLLDLFDDLRVLLSEEREVRLPSIAVIGKQSAGKSSVLERISGLVLPRGGVCACVSVVWCACVYVCVYL